MALKEANTIDLKLLGRLVYFLKPYKLYLALGVFLAIIASALAPLRPFLTKYAIDNFVSKNESSNDFLLFIILIFVVIIVGGLFQFALSYLMQWVGQRILFDMRNSLFVHIESLPVKYFDKNPVGRLVTRVTNDIEALNELFSSGVVMIIADLLLIFWIIGFMFYINPELALITLSVLPVLIIATLIFKNKVRDLFRLVRGKLAEINSFLNEFISGIITVKLFSQEKRLATEFNLLNSDYRKYMVKTVFQYAVFFPVVELLSAIALGCIIWYSSSNILSGAMTVGVFIAFIQYGEMFFRPVRDLSEKFTNLQSAMAASERIFSTLDEIAIHEQEVSNAAPLVFKDKIEFRDVSFSYDPSKPVLKDVSFEINKGDTVAIVGTTGSGKTTIINLLCRFYDFEQGNILFDNVDIRQIPRNVLLKKIALVMQDVFLFSRTVRDNISLSDDEINIEQITAAAKALGADSFIANLNSGFDTKLSERGSTLSAGQKQLLSFCRAYASSPDILILDEATSNIDSETERVIENALDLLLLNRTSIIVAHRLSTIKRANKIIVLHHGEVKEIGSHSELLAKDGFYSKLYNLQFRK